MNFKQKCRWIIYHCGVNNQVKKLNEEAYELCEAVLCRDDKQHIAEEIADVVVLLNQIAYYYNLSSEDIDPIIEQKIDRQLKRMGEGK